jgi:hypothetical protein
MLNAAAEVRAHGNMGKKFGESLSVPYGFAFTLPSGPHESVTLRGVLRRAPN